MELKDWYELAKALVTIGTLIFTAIQALLLRKQMKKEHEKRRRENTVDVMYNWCNSLEKNTSLAVDVAQQLSSPQCQSLYNKNSFEVTYDIKNDICRFCGFAQNSKDQSCHNCELAKSNENGQWIVDGRILRELRWHVVSYLNALETVFVSWHLGLLDDSTIEEQFEYLRIPGKGDGLANFRHAAGGYPITETFIDRIKEKPKTNHKSICDTAHQFKLELSAYL